MSVLVPLALTLLILAGFTALAVPQKEAQQQTLRAEAAAANFLGYRRAAMDFVRANPSHSGSINDTLLVPYWPTGYVRNTAAWPWVSEVNGGVLYVYSSTASCGAVGSCSNMVDELYRLAGKVVHVGIAVNASGLRLSNPGAGVTSISLPSSVPVGAIVAYGNF